MFFGKTIFISILIQYKLVLSAIFIFKCIKLTEKEGIFKVKFLNYVIPERK